MNGNKLTSARVRLCIHWALKSLYCGSCDWVLAPVLPEGMIVQGRGGKRWVECFFWSFLCLTSLPETEAEREVLWYLCVNTQNPIISYPSGISLPVQLSRSFINTHCPTVLPAIWFSLEGSPDNSPCNPLQSTTRFWEDLRGTKSQHVAGFVS